MEVNATDAEITCRTEMRTQSQLVPYSRIRFITQLQSQK